MTEIQSNARLIAIGDIHGYSSRLIKIIEEINPQPEDTLVFLGDFVDRGPDSKGVIQEVINLADKCNVYSILGNHEEMILAALQGGKDEHKFWCKFGGKEALESYGVEKAKDLPYDHLRFIAECHDYIETDKFIFVHASCIPHLPLKHNTGEILRWMKLDDSPVAHYTGKTVICGHTAQKHILNFKHLICIDTGCGIWPGGRLSALEVNTGDFWQFGGNAKKVKISNLKESNEPENI